MTNATPETAGYDAEAHRIEGNDDLLLMVIEDQASDIEHGWREAIQNGLDSPGSTRVELEFTEDRTVVRDDGDGVDLTSERGVKLLTHMGESDKARDDDTTVGQFGIGKGQIIAKMRTTMLSGEQALHFDIKDWGLQVRQTTVADAEAFLRAEGTPEWADAVEMELDARESVAGLTIVGRHYADETPDYDWRWNNFEDRICDRFKYTTRTTGVDVVVNGECISDGDPADEVSTHTYTHVEAFDGDAAGPVDIAVAHGGTDVPLKVYSRGVYVKDVDTRGLCGVIVTERNLSLNFARNEIKSGCERWMEISERLDAIRQDLFGSMPEGRLNSQARQAIATRMMDSAEVREEFASVPVFRTANESAVSLDEITSRTKVGFDTPGSGAADRLSEAYNMLVLDERDAAVETLRDHEAEIDRSLPPTFDPAEKAESLGLFTGHREVDEFDLSQSQRQRLAIAREIVRRSDDFDREIKWGESDASHAWTDGYKTVWLTDSAAPSRSYVEWVPELYQTLVHEFAHTTGTTEGCASHGRRFNERYREQNEDHMAVLTEVLREIRQDGLRTVVARAP